MSLEKRGYIANTVHADRQIAKELETLASWLS